MHLPSFPERASKRFEPVNGIKEFLGLCIQGCDGRLQLWERILDHLRPDSLLEVGVWKGEYAAHVLAKCDFIRAYYMLDPWRKLPDWNKPWNVDDAAFDGVYREAMNVTAFAGDKVRVLRGRTTDVINQLADESLDFAYIDGDHSLRGITIDLLSVWPKIKRGGNLAGDDLSPSIYQHDAKFEPTLVFPFALYFAEAVGAPMYAMPFNQFLIAKRDGYAFTDLVGSYGDASMKKQLSGKQGLWNRFRSNR